MLHLQPNTMRWKVEKIEFKSNTFLLYNIRMKLDTSKVLTLTVLCDMVMVIAIWCLWNRWRWIAVFTVFKLNFKLNLLTLHLNNLMTITICDLFDLWNRWLLNSKELHWICIFLFTIYFWMDSSQKSLISTAPSKFNSPVVEKLSVSIHAVFNYSFLLSWEKFINLHKYILHVYNVEWL